MSGRLLRAASSIVAILLGVGSGTAWAQNELFVANNGNNSVTVYTRTANGDVAPLRTLVGAATGLNGPSGLAVDTVNNELFVANINNNSVTVYALTANGNVAPLRTLVGAATAMYMPCGLAVDAVNNELVVASRLSDSVNIYARTANGNVAPLRTLMGAATGIRYPQDLAVDLVNNELVVTNGLTNSVTTHARTANGNVAPLRTLAGAATGLNAPLGLALDLVNNELAVSNNFGNSVTVYSRTANGNIAPLRTLAGAATGLNNVAGLAVNTVNDELAVVRNDTPALSAVLVYTRTANGNVAPVRTLGGLTTGMNGPTFLTITSGATVQPAGLVEDAHATGSTFSNVNNIIEPGETFLVNASWKNIGASPLALTGAASAFTGPGGATYSILDSAANYGTIASGATSDSFSAGGPSFRFSVSNPAARPAAHWDATFLETLSTGDTKTWTLHVGNSFSDVPVGDVSYPYVETLFHNGITNGCAPGLFCYPDILPRWQAAILLARTMLGGGTSVPTSGTVGGVGPYNCSSGGTSLFSDVLPTDVGCPHIHYIYSQQVTTGCAPGLFCPGQLMPRWQAAVFLSRAMLGPGVPVPTSGTVPSVGTYNCTSGGNSLFGDVLPTDVGCSYIHYIYSQGVTQGYGNGNFGPDDPLPRWQMAILLVKAFHIPFLF